MIALFLSVYAINLDSVIQHALKNGLQFQEVDYLTSSKLEALNVILATYDTVLSSNWQSGEEDNDTYDVGIGKNIGMGINVKGFHSKNYIGNVPLYSTGVQLDIKLLKDILGSNSGKDLLIADKQREALKLALRKSKETLIFGIVKSYLDTKKLEETITENKGLYQNILELYDATVSKYELGISEEKDLLQVEANKKNFELTIMALNRNLESSYMELETLTGKKFTNLSWPKLKLANDSKIDFNLEELKLSRERLLLEQKKYSYLPDLTLSLGYGKQDGEYTTGIGADLTFSFGNSATKSNLNSLKFSLLENDIKMKRAEQNFDKEETIFSKAINDYLKEIDLAKDILATEEKRYQSETDAYNIGRTNIANIILAKNDLISANLTLTDKTYMYDLSMANYLLHRGVLSSKFGVTP